MTSSIGRLGLLAFLAALPATSGARADQIIAVLRGLDKTTARVSTFEAPVGGSVQFGTLSIMVRQCQKRPPEEPPESAAFLQITENRPGETRPATLFSGWMFASSPSLSALQDPVYDVWVLDCRNSSAPSPGSIGK